MDWPWREAEFYLQRITKALSHTDELPHPPLLHIFYAFIGSFVGILVLSFLDQYSVLQKSDVVMIVGSFGAQAILIFATPNVPLAQPWNCIFGNAIGATVGVSSYKLFKAMVNEVDDWIWTTSAVGVSVSIVVMMLTKSLHPPAGATALIAVQGSKQLHDLGYYYVLFPAITASTIHVTIGIVMNNFSKQPSRAYPSVAFPYRLSPTAQTVDKEDPDSPDIDVDIDPTYPIPSPPSAGLELVSTIEEEV
jgi:CBS-domain-containing membrane protein